MLAALGLPVVALVGATTGYTHVGLAMGVPFAGKAWARLVQGWRKTGGPAIQWVSNRKSVRFLKTYPREAVAYGVATASAAASTSPLAGLIWHSIEGNQNFNYVLFALRAPLAAVVAITTARSLKARWSGTTKRGLALRGGIGATFTDNAAMNTRLLLVDHPQPLSFPAKTSIFGFGDGQGLLGARAVRGVHQSLHHLRFHARAKTTLAVPAMKTVGGPGNSKKGVPWMVAAAENKMSELPLRVLSTASAYTFARRHQVVSGDTWTSIAKAEGVSLIRLREVNPHLGTTLADGTWVNIPNRKDIKQVVKLSGKTIPTDTYQVPSHGVALLEGTTGKSWTWAGRRTAVPGKALRVLNAPRLVLEGGKAIRTYTRQTGDTWQSVAKKWFTSEAQLKAGNPGLAHAPLSGREVINLPSRIDIPATADWQWVETAIRTYHASRRQSLAATRNTVPGKIATPEIRVPKYSYETDAQSSRWLQVGGAGSLAVGSGVLGVIDISQGGVVGWIAVGLDAGIFAGTATTATLAAVRHRGQGTGAKAHPKLAATAAATSGLSLGGKGILGLLRSIFS